MFIANYFSPLPMTPDTVPQYVHHFCIQPSTVPEHHVGATSGGERESVGLSQGQGIHTRAGGRSTMYVDARGR